MTAVLLGIYPRTGVPAILAGRSEPSNRRDKEGLAQGTPTRPPPPRSYCRPYLTAMWIPLHKALKTRVEMENRGTASEGKSVGVEGTGVLVPRCQSCLGTPIPGSVSV